MQKNTMENSGDKKKYLAGAADIAVVLAVGSAAAFVFFRWIAGGILPFLAAFAAASCIRPAAVWMHKHSRGSLRFCSLTAAGAALCGIGGFLIWGIGKLITQAGAFLKQGMETVSNAGSWRDLLPEKILDWLDHWFGIGGDSGKGLGGLFPGKLFSEESAEKAADALWMGVQEGLGALAGWLTGAAGAFMSALPGLFLGCIIAVVAVFYLAADTGRGHIRADFFRLLPEKLHPFAGKAEGFAVRIFRTAGQYIRAYAALGSVTFFILFAGFSVMGVRYGMVWAFLTALADLLPFIGCGCVLLPWAVWCFLTGEVWRGIGLCILLVVNWLVRQFLEPRILGKMMGVHPFWMLTAMYLGLKLFGIGGMAAFPVLLGILGSRTGEMEK
ncbi:MAG: AI-2E family transporter [Clostridia bacterium]|nr:AI-2E family transporter [Clostridia bacterium]